MGMRKLKEIITDHERDIQERLYVAMTLVAIIAMAIIFVIAMILGESLLDLLLLGVGFVVMLIIVGLSFAFNRVKVGIKVIGMIIILVVLPAAFLTGGAIYGGAPLWFLYTIVFISMLLKGLIRIIYFAIDIASASFSYYIAYTHPDIVTVHEGEMAYKDSLISLLVVGGMMALLIIFTIKLYENEAKYSKKQREEIEELRKSQSRFFSNMSHEIRTPINTIIGLNEIILREENLPEEVRSDSLNIKNAGENLLGLVNDILDISKVESGRMEINCVKYRLEDLLSEVVGMLWVSAKEKNLEFNVDVDPNIPSEFYGDEMKIRQILINVLSNAIKYTKEGSVTLFIQHRMTDEENAVVTYSVVDTGIGIKKESMPYLFTAFKRVDDTKNRYIEGTGLGLSIVKQFVELMGGDIKVNSIYLEGSTFIIDIPQRVESDKKYVPDEGRTNEGGMVPVRYTQSFEAPNAKILVVDDIRSNILVVKKMLKPTKVLVDSAKSGKEALEKTMEKKYDLIFMDHMMPEMDGIECLHEIREQSGGKCKKTSIVVLTANASSEGRKLYASEGFDGYLVKPVSSNLLEAEVLKHLPAELVNVIKKSSEEGTSDVAGHGYKERIPAVITADSVCDLPQELVTRKNINMIPYHIITEEGDFLDGVEMSQSALLEYMRSGKELRSLAPKVSEYENFFASLLKSANNVIHISAMSSIGRGYENACEAAAAFENVTVIDSGQFSSGIGLLALIASSMLNGGATTEEIKTGLTDLKSGIHSGFMPCDTEGLVKSGYMKKSLGNIFDAFGIHTVVEPKNGRLGLRKFYFGQSRNTRRKYVSKTVRRIRKYGGEMVFITYVDVDERELFEIRDEIKKKTSLEDVVIQRASAAIAVKSGLNTIGFMWYANPKTK